MTTYIKVIVGLIVAVGLLLLAATFAPAVNLGASVNSYEAGVKWFGNGLYAGLTQNFSVDGNGYVDTTGQFRSTATSTTINGVTEYYLRQSSLNTATTTPCALQTPTTATTTLADGFTLAITTATSSAGTFAIGTSTTAFATSTSLASQPLAANALNTFVITPGSNLGILAPGTWITVGVSGVSYGYTYGGACTAVLRSVN
jgi:hypothetical protein